MACERMSDRWLIVVMLLSLMIGATVFLMSDG